MISLLEKFEQINIYNETRISEEDRIYCEEQQRLYKEILDATQVAIDALEKVYEDFPKDNDYDLNASCIYGDIKSMKKRKTGFKNTFIQNIFTYFKDTYKVSLVIPGKEKNFTTKVTYSDLLDEIFEQLGGYNFQEKASKEIIDKCQDTVYRKENITIRKSKLSITNFIYWNHNWRDKKQIGWNDSKVRPLFKGLSHYETGKMNTLYYYESLYEKLREGEEKYDIFQKFDLGYNMVQTIKLYKNAKIDIEFESSEQAIEFATTYLGYKQ